jgi:hypothetical protein
MFKGQMVTAHTGTTKRGTYKVVTGTIVDFEARNITPNHYVVDVVIEADGILYRTGQGRVIEVFDTKAEESVAVVETEDEVEPVEARPAIAGEVVHTVDMPGGFADYIDGTNFVAGGDDIDPDCKAARLAYEGARYIKRGRGYTLRITAGRGALDVFTDYAENLLAMADVFTRAEISGATKWLERVASV